MSRRCWPKGCDRLDTLPDTVIAFGELVESTPAPVAQMDRASASGAEGRWFEPSQAYHLGSMVCAHLPCLAKSRCAINVPSLLCRSLPAAESLQNGADCLRRRFGTELRVGFSGKVDRVMVPRQRIQNGPRRLLRRRAASPAARREAPCCGEARSELFVSSQPLFFTTLIALRMTAFFGITGP